METWVVAEILMVAMYLVNAGLYVRARKRGMTGLRRQQYMTAFGSAAASSCLARCI